MSNSTQTVRVDLEPIGCRVDVPNGSSLLHAAQTAGVELVATCGGGGTCDSCRIRLVAGTLSPPTFNEEEELTKAEVAGGVRLACQAEVLSDVRIEIPPASLATPQRLQLEGKEISIPLNPTVLGVRCKIEPPSIADLRSDERRIREQVEQAGIERVSIGLAAIADASVKLRELNWDATFVLRSGLDPTDPIELVATLANDSPILGLALDIGTTKIAGYVADMQRGVVLARSGVTNPQIAFGEDVVSRIAYADRHPDNRRRLHSRLIESINQLVLDLCSKAGVSNESIVEAVAVGNTAMHHLFAGLPVRQLGESPYVPVTDAPLTFPAAALGLNLAPAAVVYLPPNIAGYVGSDHIAMLLASHAADDKRNGETSTVLCIDIGTNTEVTLVADGRMLTCSCASGPAFEGAHIRDGMRAADGAIEHVQIHKGKIRVHTIGNRKPVGICGSGVLDAIAALRVATIIDERGRFRVDHPQSTMPGSVAGFILASASESGRDRDVTIDRSDVNEIQLAKGAIRAGIEILLNDAGLVAADVNRLVIAGAFGTYLRVDSAIEIGLFPNLPLDRFEQVGNAAGMGAIQLLFSKDQRRAAADLPKRIQYVDLTNHPQFNDVFLDSLFLSADRAFEPVAD